MSYKDKLPEKLKLIDKDERLGQYLFNRLYPRDIFYVGDKELIELIDQWFIEINN